MSIWDEFVWDRFDQLLVPQEGFYSKQLLHHIGMRDRRLIEVTVLRCWRHRGAPQLTSVSLNDMGPVS
jgi:hypothetical protein